MTSPGSQPGTPVSLEKAWRAYMNQLGTVGPYWLNQGYKSLKAVHALGKRY